MSRKKESAKTMARRILRPGGYWLPETKDAKIEHLRRKLRELALAVIRDDRAAREEVRRAHFTGYLKGQASLPADEGSPK